MNVPRVCVVGAGRLSSRRIYPSLGAAGLQLVGTCDLNEALAIRTTTLYGGRPYTDLSTMLSEEQPDGVIVCIGPEAHAELAQKILRDGFPVYTEKPPAPTVDDAIAVARTAAETGLLCMTAFKKRYSLAFDHARRWLEQFPPERWLSISVDYCGGSHPQASGQPPFLRDFAIHHLDLVHYLMGDVANVCAYRRANAFAVALRFASGAVGSLHFNDGRSFVVPTEELELTVSGGNFLTISNSSRWREVRDGQPAAWREPPTFVSSGDSGHDTGHLAELEAFAGHLRDGAPVRSPIDESLKSLVLHDAIITSVDIGTPVSIDYPAL